MLHALKFSLFLMTMTFTSVFGEEIVPLIVFAPKTPVFKNGDCIQHKFQPEISYAISGKEGTYYQLVVLENGQLRSMIMGFPEHSSEFLINEMFEKIECHIEPSQIGKEIFEDFYDPYRQTTASFKNMK